MSKLKFHLTSNLVLNSSISYKSVDLRQISSLNVSPPMSGPLDKENNLDLVQWVSVLRTNI